MTMTVWLMIGVCSSLFTVCDGSSLTADGDSGIALESPAEYVARLQSIRSFKLGEHRYIRTSRDAPLGQGIFGVVFEAVQLPEESLVAVKCAIPNDKTFPGSMLAHEVSIAKLLNGLP